MSRTAKISEILGLTILPLGAAVSAWYLFSDVRGDVLRMFSPYNAQGYQIIAIVFAVVGAIQGVKKKAFWTNFVPWLSLGIIAYCWLVMINGS